MASLTECPDCEKHFVGARCVCGYVVPVATPDTVWQRPAWMEQPPPCTAEENERAAQNVRAVLDGDITPAQAQAVLRAIFKGREAEL